MDHFPGTLFVTKVQAALAEGKQIVVYARGIGHPLAIDGVQLDGPLAVFSSPNGEWIIRLDALIGLNVATPYDVGALVG
ncbi:hypothetical protein [Sphingomonas sp. 8AM]|uniref:hypothetical protein n=1 Tax=Sphingomonas sp. 8AM TaxID=2653170 RepID=UPI0012EF0E9E|nr:hypothetical protein [Sphingomonas sp. 8AM]VXC90902.1 hypothetical protein SPHINGO8AM_330023 [Sphingomonas sp. 8AM]